MSVYFKAGVCGRMSRPIRWILGIAERVADARGLPLIILSIAEAVHGPGTLHQMSVSSGITDESDAADFTDNANHHPPMRDTWQAMCNYIKGLGDRARYKAEDFDAVLEYDHWHVEYDPKGKS